MIHDNAFDKKMDFRNPLTKYESEHDAHEIHPECVNKPVRRITHSSQIRNYSTSSHAIDRARERGGLSKWSAIRVHAWIENGIKSGRLVKPKRPSEVIHKLVTHDGPSEYCQFNGVVLVISNNIIVTVLDYDPDYWIDAT